MGHGAFIRSEKHDYGPTRELCDGCPVPQECLEAALDDDSLVGLWGGMTERERREMRRRAA
jgi:WhiB family redox-sensing transcriptional regulator